MAKDKLNNLLSFKDFTGELPINKQKKTKRTDVGLDILNENFFDKLVFKVNNDRPLEASLKEFKDKLVTAATSGQISDLVETDGGFEFTTRARNFKIGNGKASISTPITKSNTKIEDWATFDLPKDVEEEIIGALEDIDYL